MGLPFGFIHLSIGLLYVDIITIYRDYDARTHRGTGVGGSRKGRGKGCLRRWGRRPTARRGGGRRTGRATVRGFSPDAPKQRKAQGQHTFIQTPPPPLPPTTPIYQGWCPSSRRPSPACPTRSRTTRGASPTTTATSSRVRAFACVLMCVWR